MTEYHFRLIVTGRFTGPPSDEELLEATDALGEAACDDCSVSAHGRYLELEFDRARDSLEEAIASAVRDVENAGFTVESIEMDRAAVIPAGAG